MFFRIFLLTILLHVIGFSQPKTNFEIIDSLVQKEISDFIPKLKVTESYNFKFSGADSYRVFESKIKNILLKSGVNLVDEQSNDLIFSIDEIKCSYPEIEKEGMFGEYIVKRNLRINGNIIVNSNEVLLENKINSTYSDIIPYNQLDEVENIAYPFTTSKEPEIPLFSSLIEPAIAVGTAAVVTYLFFNVRSK